MSSSVFAAGAFACQPEIEMLVLLKMCLVSLSKMACACCYALFAAPPPHIRPPRPPRAVAGRASRRRVDGHGQLCAGRHVRAVQDRQLQVANDL
jgi:hypothetical protein